MNEGWSHCPDPDAHRWTPRVRRQHSPARSPAQCISKKARDSAPPPWTVLRLGDSEERNEDDTWELRCFYDPAKRELTCYRRPQIYARSSFALAIGIQSLARANEACHSMTFSCAV